MPGKICHMAFAEMVYRKIVSYIPLDKFNFISGNIIPDISIESKKLTHYRKKASIPDLYVPDMKLVEKEFFMKENPIKLGIYAHLYLDERFIERFLIPSFIWNKERMVIENPRNGLEWGPDFFCKEGKYYEALDEINQMLIKDGYVSKETILGFPEELPNVGVSIYDNRQNNWKKEIVESINLNEYTYTGEVFDYYEFVKFMEETAIELIQKIIV